MSHPPVSEDLADGAAKLSIRPPPPPPIFLNGATLPAQSSNDPGTLHPPRPTRAPPPPRRSSSYATVVPAATPLEAPISPSKLLPSTPTEYLTPQHTQLTPLRAHYLKRELVGGQLARELSALADPNALSRIGWPFDPRPNAPSHTSRDEEDDLPFLRFFLHHFVMTFPFLSQVDTKTFYSKKLQPFIESFLARNISLNEERTEEGGSETKRHKLAGKAEKHLGLLISSAVKLNDNNGREEVVRIVDVKSAPMPSTNSAPPPLPPKDSLSPRSSMSASSSSSPSASSTPSTPSTPHKNHSHPQQEVFQVNVVGVRTVVTKLRLGRKSKHEEFIVRTSRFGYPDVFVSRRYGDFVKLSEMLRNEYPEHDIRAPPPKDRRGVDSSATANPTPPPSAGADPSSTAPPSAASSTFSSATSVSVDSDNASISDSSAPVLLNRERNRLTLRAYLRQLMRDPDIANSSILQGFLLRDPTVLTPAEEADAAKREELDKLRESETDKFRSEVENRVKELEKYLRLFKDELVKQNGLSRVFATIRNTPRMEDLPIEYKKVMEWSRISLASTIYQLFLGSDNSSAMFSQFKRIHGLLPYFMMRQILKISNPVSMIRSILDLFLARPFGSSSLLQRIFSSGLETEIKDLKDDMQKVQAKIEDDVLCERVKRFMYAPREVQIRYREEAKAENIDILTVILRQANDYPQLSPQAMQRVHRAAIAYKEYQDWVATLADPEEEDEGPEDDDAWLYEDLHVLMRMAMRVRDKEQVLELIFEGATSDLLKDIVTIFYEPLAKVYKAANISDSLYDLQIFANDLIKTVESAEANVASAHADPQRTVTVFMDLVQRHEGAFYNFVHQVHSKGEDLFDGLMHWIELFLTFIREGLNPEGISLEFLLPHGGAEREEIFREIDSLIEYHRMLKIAHHERLRRRLVKGEISGAANYITGASTVGSPGQVGFGGAPTREADAAFIGGVLNNLSMSGVADDIDDLNAEHDTDSEDEDGDVASDEFVDAESTMDGSSEHDHGGHGQPSSSVQTQSTLVVNLPPSSGPSSSYQHQQIYGQPPPPGNKPPPKTKNGKKQKATAIVEPELIHIPKLVPIFTEMLRPSLETAQRIQMLKAQQQNQRVNKSTLSAQAVLRR